MDKFDGTTYNVWMLWSILSGWTNPPTSLGCVLTSYLTAEALAVQNQIKLPPAWPKPQPKRQLHNNLKQCISPHSPTHRSSRRASTAQCKSVKWCLMKENLSPWCLQSTSTRTNTWRWQPTHSKFPTHNHSSTHPPMHNGGTLPQLQAPPSFHNPPPTNNNHQGYNMYHKELPHMLTSMAYSTCFVHYLYQYQ